MLKRVLLHPELRNRVIGIGGYDNFMGKRKKRLLYELTREPEEGKLSVQDFAKRLLIGFFVMMLLLTAVSRAAASVIVAKVEVTSAQKGVLSFKVEGSGKVEAKAEKYLDLLEGIRIEEVNCKEGQRVEKGDTLLQYDQSDLKELLGKLEVELRKAELSYKKDKLSLEEAEAGTTAKAAEIALERAELDLDIAREDLYIAKKTVDKDKKEQYQTKEKAYFDEKEAYEEQKLKKNKAMKEAEKEVTKAEEALEELYTNKTEIVTALAEYKSAVEHSNRTLNGTVQEDSKSNSDLKGNRYTNGDIYFNDTIIDINKDFNNMLDSLMIISEKSTDTNEMDPIDVADTNIFMKYYGEEFENHKNKVLEGKQALERAREDYLVAMVGAAESGGMLTTSVKVACIRAYQDASEILAELTEKDTEISVALINYGASIQGNSGYTVTDTYNTLFSLLYSEDSDEKKVIKAAEETITSAKEKMEDTRKEWEITLHKKEEAVNLTKEEYSEAKEIYDQILDNTFDYSEKLRSQQRQIDTANRNLEAAKESLADARKSDSKVAVSKEQLNNINLELSELDIQGKKEAVDTANTILKKKGKVSSPVTGIILKLDVEVGIKTTGTEKVSIAVEDYGFIARVTKDEAKHLSAGDEISIKIGDSHESMKAYIENLGLEDAEGWVEISAILPNGEYKEGTTAAFVVNKTSEQYRQTIPIQALRTDGVGANYVLITRENNTILGNELTAERINVTVLEKDYSTAAIEDSLTREAVLIVSSNKNIEEGDRVRVNESND
jgi:multidrug efflux pump subunit AcrA (membrane-fusion protein)